MAAQRPAEFTAEVQRRHAAGESVRTIAAALGCSYRAAYDVLQRRQGLAVHEPVRQVARLRYLISRGVMP